MNQRFRFLVFCLLRCAGLLLTPAHADIASDYAALTHGIPSWPSANSSQILVYGEDSFPVLKDGTGRAAAAAGHLIGEGGSGARAFVIGHDGILNVGSSSNAAWQTFLTNIVTWAGGTGNPIIRYDSSMNTAGAWLAGQGFTSLRTNLNNLEPDSCDVYLYAGWTITTDNSRNRLQDHVTNGGSIVFGITGWAVPSYGNHAAYVRMNQITDRFGLHITDTYVTPSTSVSPSPGAADHGPGALAILADYFDGAPLPSNALQATARTSLSPISSQQRSAEFPLLAAFLDQVEALAAAQSVINIQPTTAPFLRNSRPPAEDWLIASHSTLLQQWAPADLPSSPGAAGWPGAVPAGAPRVTKTVTVNGEALGGNGIGSNQYGINHHGRHVFRPTGLYCPPSNNAALYPGAGGGGNTHLVTLTFPSSVVNRGVQVQINHDIENMIGAANSSTRYNRWPLLPRSFEVTSTQVTVGSAHGGLVLIMIPPGVDLGSFEVTVSGAVECPGFELGVTTEAEWDRLRAEAQAPWGYVLVPDHGPESPDYGMFLPIRARFLTDKDSRYLRSVAQHWKRTLRVADNLMGIKQRQRGEAAVSGLDITVGGGHAGYPFIMDYGDSGLLAGQRFLNQGDWGYHHELGHTYQDTRGSDFDIATHGEVFVNLVPYLLLNHVHGIRSPDSAGIHDDYDHAGRISRFQNWLNEIASDASVAWGGGTYGNDAQYELVQQFTDAFGWETWRKALESEWDARTNGQGNTAAGRDRFFLMLCNAAERNLIGLFDRFRIAVSAQARAQVASFPAWSQNQAPSLVLPASGPLSIDLSSATEDQLLARIGVSDPDPANVHRFSITGGNASGAFALDPSTGHLILRNPHALAAGTASLTLTVTDESVPPLSDTQSLAIQVTQAGGLSGVANQVFAASSSQSAGTVLGHMGGTGVTGWEIVSGNDDHALAIDSAGAVTLATPAALPDRQPRFFTLQAQSGGGATRHVTLTLLCGFDSAAGVTEERWNAASSGTDYTAFDFDATPPSYTGTRANLSITANAGDLYIRRLKGYLIVPRTGEYTFWIAGDDQCQFSLSSDASPERLSVLCRVENYTGIRQWTAESGQRSAAIPLEAGEIRYFEVLQRDGGGADHVQVAWTGPDLTTQTDLSGSALVRSVRFDSSSWFAAVHPGQPAGTILHPFATTGSVTRWSISSGDPDGIFDIDASGNLILARPHLLPSTFTILSLRIAAQRSDGSSAVWFASLAAPCLPGIQEELWTGRSGSLVADFDFDAPPAAPVTGLLATASREGSGTDYARKLSGLFLPQTTGNHRFWLTASHPGGAYANSAELWISPTADPAGLVRQAWIESPKPVGDFDLAPRQWTYFLPLSAGKAYYYEVRQKHGAAAGDHVSLAWTGPAEADRLHSSQPGAYRTLVDDSVSLIPDAATVVHLSASAAEATEGGEVIDITVSRSGDLSAPLEVTLTLAGSATLEDDYQVSGLTLSGTTGSLVIPAGESGASFQLTPLADLIDEPEESIVISLAEGSGWIPGEPAALTITLRNAPVSTLTLIASPAAGGSVSGGGVYPQGGTPAIVASPASGWHFDGWTGDGIADPSAAETTILLETDQTVTARFLPNDPYLVWASEHQLGELSGKNDDADGDGLSNYAEYLLDLDPKDPASRLTLTLWDLDSGQVRLRINRISPLGSFVLRHSATLEGDWQEMPLTFPPETPSADFLLELPRAGGRRFYQLTYTPPED